jgi:2Fe-2S ferredoxin
MPTVTYVQPHGTRTTCRIGLGASVMDGALDNGVPGILGQCGGGCTCATCHCYVQEPFLDRLPPPHPDEAEMLECVRDRRRGSLLACQIFPDESLSGLVVEVPDR